MNGTTQPAPLDNAGQIVGMIAELQTQLQSSAPGYQSLLHQIHQILAKDDSLVHLLTPEQVGVIVAGLSKKKNVVIAELTKAGKGNSKKALMNISINDL